MDDLWAVADRFRSWVCCELRNLSDYERKSLQGDYLFSIDKKPRFIVMVGEQGAWSLVLNDNNDNNFDMDVSCPWSVSAEQISQVINGSARVTVMTDASTLEKLLQGKLKARVAFLTAKVTIMGDLPVFLKMTSLLKKRGVTAITV